MWIRSIEVAGFKTYTRQQTPTKFHPGRNLIVGYNGAGKSNVLDAILFVVSESVVSMRPGGRGGGGGHILEHEGEARPFGVAASVASSGYVELELDNTSRQAPLDMDVITLRRRIADRGFVLNGKPAGQQEVFDLLEAANISVRNPHYAIKQGKISELAALSEKNRLKLVHDLLGTAVFDQRKKLAEQELLELVEKKKPRAEEIIADLDVRIAGLAVEEEELKEFERMELRKRVLEGKIAQFELQDSTTKMGAYESEKRIVEMREKKLMDRVKGVEAAVKAKKKEVYGLEDRLAVLAEGEKVDCEEALRGLEAEAAELFGGKEADGRDADHLLGGAAQILSALLMAEDSQDVVGGGTSSCEGSQELDSQGFPAGGSSAAADAKRETAILKRKLEEEESLLSGEEEQLKRADREEATAFERLTAAQTAAKSMEAELLALKAENSEEAAQQLREKVIPKLRKEMGANDFGTRISKAEAALAVKKNTAGGEGSMVDLQRNLKKFDGEWEEAKKACFALDRRNEDFSEQRRRLLADDTRTKQTLQQKKDQLAHTKNRLTGTFPRGVRNALLHFESPQNQPPGTTPSQIHGTLLENITIDQVYQVCVESVGGVSLLNLLVDNDKIAGDILTAVREQKLGSIECVPLDRLKNASGAGSGNRGGEDENCNLPPSVKETLTQIESESKSKAFAICDIIHCENWVQPAVKQVFGSWIVCETLEMCETVSKKLGYNCITLDGDRVLASGFFSGGYVNPDSFQRISLQRKLTHLKQDVEDLEKKAAKIGGEMSSLEKSRGEMKAELEKAYAAREKARRGWCDVDRAIEKMKEETYSLEKEAAKLKAEKRGAEVEFENAEKRLKGIEEKLARRKNSASSAAGENSQSQTQSADKDAIETLAEQLQDAKATMAALEQNHRKSTQSRLLTLQKIEERKATVSDLKQQYEQSEAISSKTALKKERLRKAYRECNAKLKKINEEIGVLEGSHNFSLGNEEQNQKSLSDVKQELANLEQEKLNASSDLEETKGKVDFFASKIVAEFTRTEDAKQRLANYRMMVAGSGADGEQINVDAPAAAAAAAKMKMKNHKSKGGKNKDQGAPLFTGEESGLFEGDDLVDQTRGEEDAAPASSVTDLLLELTKLNQQLEQGYFNRKALHEATDYKLVREKLFDELRSVDSQVKTLTDNLEQTEKNKQLIFGQMLEELQVEFREIFRELTGGGKGELVYVQPGTNLMKAVVPGGGKTTECTGADSKQTASSISDSVVAKHYAKKRKKATGNFSDESATLAQEEGLRCEIVFPSQQGADQAGDVSSMQLLSAGQNSLDMKQLSGGQRTMCALALLLSLLKLRPAPFYLLDEVDAALDPEHRKNVATYLEKMFAGGRAGGQDEWGPRAADANAMEIDGEQADEPAVHDLEEASEGGSSSSGKISQLLITSFRPELIEKSDKIFIVENQNRTSTIRVATAVEAKEVVNAASGGGMVV
mmetsp:Transcript_27732/g.69954  ORF Transcript_27732/g.69954 Transcript_27732/m.69954 type:complete len:1468 (-) Transcript_27732:632-5035(-)|eukprot:CAMPEP_0179002000 /NCGR_PEP_ID=MMETSP0795-20121207/11723_1 /TAXON_ID=88552 /ORGANISM="Amoebophrya sp., Strain Ameob2" /LENGTH=1467 /DNA_ID=CAMNT_0020695537 /DNA_START=115 /DNA_END=4518 /DNA_ORIENTATION=-